MPRPFCKKIVNGTPRSTYFKPAGIPMNLLDELTLKLDEFEALRLADFEGLYQEDAAKKMGISRPTFSRLIEAARKKISTALVNGRALKIENKYIPSDTPTPIEQKTGGRRRWRGCR